MNLSSTWHDFIYALWFFLPAGVANATPVLAKFIPIIKDWRAPLDSHKSLHGKRLLGDNKTWRGLVTGVSLGALVGLLQYFIVPPKHSLLFAVIAATLMGLGALLGDALESFFKRQLNIPPGKVWFPFDQLDYIIGGLIVSYPLIHTPLRLILAVAITWFVAHLVAVYIGYIIGIRDKPI